MANLALLLNFVIIFTSFLHPSSQADPAGYIDCMLDWKDFTNIQVKLHSLENRVRYVENASSLPEPFRNLTGEGIFYLVSAPRDFQDMVYFREIPKNASKMYIKYYVHTAAKSQDNFPVVEAERSTILNTTSDLKWKEVWLDAEEGTIFIGVSYAVLPVYIFIDSLILYDGGKFEGRADELHQVCRNISGTNQVRADEGLQLQNLECITNQAGINFYNWDNTGGFKYYNTFWDVHFNSRRIPGTLAPASGIIVSNSYGGDGTIEKPRVLTFDINPTYLYVRYYLDPANANASLILSPVVNGSNGSDRISLPHSNGTEWREEMFLIDTGSSKNIMLRYDYIYEPGIAIIDTIALAQGLTINSILEIKALCPEWSD